MGAKTSGSEQVIAVRLHKDKSSLESGDHIPVSNLGGDRAIFRNDAPTSRYQQGAKRAFDIIAATIGLFLFSPLLLLVSIAIKLDSPGPIFSRQIRHDYNNKTFSILMFRSANMKSARGYIRTAGKRSSPTRVGRILRGTGIDRLPQLINILRGEMSVVGPSPLLNIHGMIFEEQIRRISRRREVKPGITGWAQVNGYWGENDSFKAMQRCIEHDLYYIKNCSFLLDMKIILMTLLSTKAYGQSHR
jgi:lipopolysaccharide/colanic/teichoic acid biosynthesis glycosyltransferase